MIINAEKRGYFLQIFLGQRVFRKLTLEFLHHSFKTWPLDFANGRYRSFLFRLDQALSSHKSAKYHPDSKKKIVFLSGGF